MANNEWGDFQTPIELAERVLGWLGDRSWGRVLEPTCGMGRFLQASGRLGPDVERIGIEVQPEYVNQAEALGFTVISRSIFDLSLGQDLNWRSEGPLLVIGNPPWVTSAQLGSLSSINLPPKSNIRSLKGLDAMTGASNFDIAEFIFLKLMIELEADKPTISLLVKTQVARNVLSYAEQFDLPYSGFKIRGIDAKSWFGASVDACLFTVEYSDVPEYFCEVYPSIDGHRTSHTIGVVEGRLVADVDRYERTCFADGECPVEWRSGVKHDASAVMEIKADALPALDLEPEYVYPLLKSTDIFRGRLQPTKVMVIPQRRFGEDTGHLQDDAPSLWAYLESHASALDSRGSSIYRNQPRFAMFGLGDYTFSPFKVAISGLHKEVRFVPLGPFEGRPIVVDDACYTLSFHDGLEAAMCFALLVSEATADLLGSLVFWDAKRPISKRLLRRVDLSAVARTTDLSDLEPPANQGARQLGLDPPLNWLPVLDRLLRDWANPPRRQGRLPRLKAHMGTPPVAESGRDRTLGPTRTEAKQLNIRSYM